MIILRQKEFGLFSIPDKKKLAEEALQSLESDGKILHNFIPKNTKYLMEVEDIFNITGRGTVLTGKLDREVKEGDDILVYKSESNTAIKTKVKELEMFRKVIKSGKKGDDIGILVDISSRVVKRTDKLYLS